MAPRFRPLVAALGLLASLGAHADKGGVPNGGNGNGGNGRGGARFADSPGPGPANAFDNHAQLVKSGGLEFHASANARAPSLSSHERKPRDNAAVLTPAAGPSGDPAPAQDELALAFAPWKVTDKDGKPAEKKPLECGSK